MDLGLELEEKFNISIPDKDIGKLFSQKADIEYRITNHPGYAPVKGIADYINKKIKRQV